MTTSRLRYSEWLLLSFFTYIVVLMPFFSDRPLMSRRPVVFLIVIAAIVFGLALAERGRYATLVSHVRDWLPMVLTLVAFREMEFFVPAHYNEWFERAWIEWDKTVLYEWGLKRAIESLGPLIPAYLELCYVLVYGVGTFCVIVLWVLARRRNVDRFYLILLTGTLVSYALFPFFPTRPPRLAFPDVGFPVPSNTLRTLNLFLLKKGTIHSGVFPSAHVSSAFAAAWAMFLVLPDRKRYAWGLLIYASSVAVATVYGRYHYAADAVAGFGVSLIAALLCLVLKKRAPHHQTQ
jgi:membrane-associated phospholipid phosphatase